MVLKILFMKGIYMNFKVEKLCKKYYKNEVISNFNYDFKVGLYLLTGVNGSGKSTLLKCLAKIITVSNDNCRMSSIKKAYLCEKCVVSNGKPKTYLKNIMYLNKTCFDIEELLNKWKIANKAMWKLSKGNIQKIGILAMLISESEIFFFDEPTDALDQDSILLFLEAVKELSKDKIVVIATHEIEYFKGLDYVQISLDQYRETVE